jgi:hypothetical protein
LGAQGQRQGLHHTLQAPTATTPTGDEYSPITDEIAWSANTCLGDAVGR